MRKSLAAKILSVLAVGIVLAHLSPVAMVLELCIGDGTDPNCCRNPHSAQARVDETAYVLDDSDCGCCITVEVVPSAAGATSQKASLDLLSVSELVRCAAASESVHIARLGSHDLGDSRLSSLRTGVLLI
ncbi:MAG: hypothetical protein KJO18_01985 [Acidimicrobiia bacterium]|nr:hypothetical protein [Acidimicrobiia bacterium]